MKEIKIRYNIRQGDFVLDVDLSIASHGVTALFGPSGCGKTTLLRAMAGLDYHRGGMLKVGEIVWQDDGLFVPPHQRSLGYVFQEASLFSHLTVRCNLEYGLKRLPKTERRISLDKVVELLGIGGLLERKPGHLSGGERQRVAIARALAVSPRLLLMDEPLASLDRASKQDILPYLEAVYNELEIPVIYVSHTPEEVARLAHHLILLQDGQVVATGPIHDMLTRLDLPLAHGSDAASIVETVVTGHDEKYHLTHLKFGEGHLTVTRGTRQLGDPVRLWLPAHAVSLTLRHQSNTSIRNIFPATVEEINAEGEAQVIVRLLAGHLPILSQITRKSADELDLKPGKKVYAQVKSVVLLNA